MAIDIDKMLKGLGTIVSVNPICAMAVLTPNGLTKKKKEAERSDSHGGNLERKDATIQIYHKGIARGPPFGFFHVGGAML